MDCKIHEKENKGTCSKLLASLFILVLTIASVLPAFADEYKDEQTLRDAAHVLDEMFKSKSIPPDLFKKAICVAVMPNVKKFSVGIGGAGGRGPMSCRKGADHSGKWSPPAMYTIAGVSAGVQLGGSSTDFVLLIMSQKGLDAILKGKTKLGADATAAAGPGADAKGTPGGDILTYSRAKGLFAGASLGGVSIDADTDANKRIYGEPVPAADIVKGASSVKTTEAGQPLVTVLNAHI
jgi:lipid-binding SYLF domain-containing protein